MVLVLGAEGLNEPTEAVRVLQIVVAAHPTSASLFAKSARPSCCPCSWPASLTPDPL